MNFVVPAYSLAQQDPMTENFRGHAHAHVCMCQQRTCQDERLNAYDGYARSYPLSCPEITIFTQGFNRGGCLQIDSDTHATNVKHHWDGCVEGIGQC